MATEPSPDNVGTLTLTLGMPWLPCSGCFKGSTHNVGHQESPQVGRQRDVASSTGTQGMPMAGRSHSPHLPSHCAWAPASSPGLL